MCWLCWHLLGHEIGNTGAHKNISTSLFTLHKKCSILVSKSSVLFLPFPEFAETLPPWPSGIALLCPNQNEPIKHAVLRERRNAPSTPRRHDCGWVRLPVTATTASDHDLRCRAVWRHRNDTDVQKRPICEEQKKTLSQKGKKSSLIFVTVHCEIAADLCAEIGFLICNVSSGL